MAYLVKVISMSLTALFFIAMPAWYLSDKHIDVVFLHIPNGEATAIVDYEDEKAILINTGASTSRQMLMNQLEKLSIDKLDAIFITNNQEEYIGNLEYLMNAYPDVQVYGPSNLITSTDFPDIQEWVDKKEIIDWGDLHFQIIDVSSRGNISFVAQFGNENILFLNDGQEDIDQQVIDQLNIDIIKIAEFASGYTPSDHLLAMMDPYVSIIFTSKNHQLNKQLIEMLNTRWIDIYFVNKTGSIYIRFTEDDYEILSKNQSVFFNEGKGNKNYY